MENLTKQIYQKNQIEEAGKIWQDLEAQVENVGLTSSWLWIKTWLDHFGDVVDYWFFVGKHNNCPVGIALITKETHRPLPIPVNAYHVGTNGEPYPDQIRMIGNKILIKNTYRAAFHNTLLETLIKDFNFEELIFDDYSLDEAEVLTKVIGKKELKFSTKIEPCDYFDLDMARKNKLSILENLGKQTRHSVRRSLKLFPDLKLEWAENPQQAVNILEELSRLYQNTWQKRGKTGMFASTRFASFQKNIIRKLFKQGSVILIRVTSKQYGTLGCLYLFVENETAYAYQMGINDFANTTFPNINKKRLKTGLVVITSSMQECLNRGIKKYNFLIGDYDYKKGISNGVSRVVTITISKNLKPLIRDALLNLYFKVDSHKKISLFLKPLRQINNFLLE